MADETAFEGSTSLADLGCPGTGGQPDWVVSLSRQSGRTPDADVSALIAATGRSSGLAATLAPTGYPVSTSQTYLISRDGKPWATATVAPDDQGTGYVAGLDRLC